MIKYKLNCKSCNLVFDSWFASSKEYEKLKKKNLLNCHSCNSLDVEKTLMAPRLISKNQNHEKNNQLKNLRKKINKYQKFIQKISNMSVKILRMRQDQYTITTKKKKSQFTALHQKKI